MQANINNYPDPKSVLVNSGDVDKPGLNNKSFWFFKSRASKNGIKIGFVVLFLLIIGGIAFGFSGRFFGKRSQEEIKVTTEKNSWHSYNQSLMTGNVTPVGSVVEVSLSYDLKTQDIKIDNLAIKNGYAGDVIKDTYSYQIILSKGNDVLYSRGFNVPEAVYSPPPLNGSDTGMEPVISQVKFVLTIPDVSIADSVQIFDSNDRVVTQKSLTDAQVVDNTPEFSTVTGDQLSENKTSFIQKIWDSIFGKVYAQTTKHLDITFVSDGYGAGGLDKFHNDVSRMSSYIINNYEPFKTRAAQISFHYVDNTKDLGCQYQGRLILCNNTQVFNVVNDSGVPHDTVVVLENNDTYGGSAYIGLLAVAYNGGPWSSQVFVHELGHAFGRLLDEYITNSPNPDTSKNCYSGKIPDSNWQGIVGNNSYFLGCDHSDFYRSSETSIMRQIDAEYFNGISRYWLNYYMDQYAGPYASPTEAITPEVTNNLSPTQVPGANSTQSTSTPTPTSESTSSSSSSSSSSSNSSNSQESPTATPTTSVSNPTSTPTPTNTPTSTPSPTPTTPSNPVTITYPNGGETFHIGDNVHITWQASITGDCWLSFFNNDASPIGFTNVLNQSAIPASQEYYDWTASFPAGPPGMPYPTLPVDGYFKIVCPNSVIDNSDGLSHLQE